MTLELYLGLGIAALTSSTLLAAYILEAMTEAL